VALRLIRKKVMATTVAEVVDHAAKLEIKEEAEEGN